MIIYTQRLYENSSYVTNEKCEKITFEPIGPEKMEKLFKYLVEVNEKQSLVPESQFKNHPIFKNITHTYLIDTIVH